mgnify:CR=1 FL=1
MSPIIHFPLMDFSKKIFLRKTWLLPEIILCGNCLFHKGVPGLASRALPHPFCGFISALLAKIYRLFIFQHFTIFTSTLAALPSSTLKESLPPRFVFILPALACSINTSYSVSGSISTVICASSGPSTWKSI